MTGWADPGHAARYRERVLAERDRLARALADPLGRQRAVLADLLEFNAGTEFGVRHGFGRLDGVDAYRRAVPVHDYAAIAPLVERMAAGEPNVLSSDPPVVFFSSSGSTGVQKKIPVTPRFVRTTFLPFYFAAWAPLIESHPDVMARPDAVLNLKHDPPTAPPVTAAGRPHVGASQVDFGAAFGEPLAAELGTAAPWATLPVDVAQDDYLEKAYLRLRLAVHADLRAVIGINPAMLAALPYQLNLWWERIVKEVRDGTLGGVPHRDPDPRRAAELEYLADYFGTVRPAHVWPNIRALFGWTAGAATLYLPALREEFGVGVAALPAPVAASEGPVGVPLDRHMSAGSLVVSAALYEFLDADTDLAPDVDTLLAHELEAGREYQVIFSHVGGLYRYAVGDVVRVVDVVSGVPRVAYAGRVTRSDAVGERLRESHVVRALVAALTSTGLGLRNAACRVDRTGGVPRYEFAAATATPWREAETTRFGTVLDTELAREAAGYRRARRAGALSAPVVRVLGPDAFHREWHGRVAGGMRPPQVKDRLFRQDDDQWRRLTVTASTGPRS